MLIKLTRETGNRPLGNEIVIKVDVFHKFFRKWKKKYEFNIFALCVMYWMDQITNIHVLPWINELTIRKRTYLPVTGFFLELLYLTIKCVRSFTSFKNKKWKMLKYADISYSKWSIRWNQDEKTIFMAWIFYVFIF